MQYGKQLQSVLISLSDNYNENVNHVFYLDIHHIMYIYTYVI